MFGRSGWSRVEDALERSTIDIAGCEIEVHQAGEGKPLLYLHPAGGFQADHAFLPLLGEGRRLVCPSHPGFGRSSLPDWIDSVDDIAHIYLELMDRLDLHRTDIVGCSIGGWIAAELATKTPERFARMVLVGPVGVKTGPADRLDIPDMFVMAPPDVQKMMFHDPAKMAVDPSKLSDDALAIMLRNRETLALLAWEPYMHNPKLAHRLHRVASPTLFVRGASDGLVSEAYLEAYARLIPGAHTAAIAEAGHAPHIEQPQAFAEMVRKFLDR